MIEIKNMADTMIYTTEKMMKDVEEKKIPVTDAEKQAVTDTLAKVKELKDKDDMDALKKASEDLTKAAQAVGMKMYQQESASAKASSDKATENPSSDAQSKKDDGAVEGEVVDDKKS